ncbi:MAG TPA: DUF1801 domain-containing protein [Thermoanaerobaculia bacterium]|nr:DUF1801 domain-containing protein [Thermoanaerobaculia bacterium]
MTSKKAPARPKKKTTAKLTTQPTAKSVEAFLGGIEDEHRRKEAFELLALMKKVTKKEPRMWGAAIVGFGDAHYEYASGRSGDWFEAGFSPRKAALAVYLMGGLQEHAGMIASLGKVKTGGGCLYISRLDDVDRAALSRLIAASVASLPGRA